MYSVVASKAKPLFVQKNVSSNAVENFYGVGL